MVESNSPSDSPALAGQAARGPESTDQPRRLLILGLGFSGSAIATLARRLGRVVVGTRRTGDASSLPEGLELLVGPDLAELPLEALVDDQTDLVVSFPPSEPADRVALGLAQKARRTVYLSTTGVYGDTHGTINESSPCVPTTERAQVRLATETRYREVGAIILRLAGIYGPGRGLLHRLREGTFQIPGDGNNFVSRIHVDDVAVATIAALDQADPGEVFVVADDEPATIADVVTYMCREFALPMPASVPIDQVSETLRHDRQVDASRIKTRLNITWLAPNYRVGVAPDLAREAGDPLLLQGLRAIGSAIKDAWNAMDPDVPRHVADLPLLALTMIPKRQSQLLALPDDGFRPILCVHGLGGHPANFAGLRGYLRFAKGRKRSYSVALPSSNSLYGQAEAVAAAIDEILRVNGLSSDSKVDVIAHSMGGMVARLALQLPEVADRIAHLVTLGSPHSGTYLARYGATEAVKALRPGSTVHAELATQLPWCGPPVMPRLISIWSPNDLMLLPPESAQVQGAQNIEVERITHYGFLLSPRVFRIVAEKIT